MGAAALAATSGTSSAAAQTGAAGGSAAGAGGAGGSAAGAGAGGAAAGGTTAAAGGTTAAASAAGTAAAATGAATGATAAAGAGALVTAGAAGAATGATGLVAALGGVSVVGWVAVGAVAAAAVIAAAVIAVSGDTSTTNSADQASPASSASSVVSETEFTDDTLSSGTIALTEPATETAVTTDTSIIDTTAETVTDTSVTDTSVTDTSTTDTSIVAELSPAVLTPTNLTISQPLIAGGTGAFSLTVKNTGQLDSDPNVPLDITLPSGVTVQSVDVTPGAFGLRRAANGFSLARAPAECLPAEGLTCSVPLGVVAPNASVVVTITVNVPPDLRPDTTATVSVRIFGVELSTTIGPDQIQAGIASLTASPSGPYFAPSTAVLDITVTPRDGVTTPGPLTFVLTGETWFGGAPANCSAVDAPTQQITCTDTGPTVSGVTVNIGPGQSAGALPLTVMDAGGRVISLTNPPQVIPMDLSPIQTGDIFAGRGQLASLQVTNNGTVPSPATAIGYSLPPGVSAASIDAGAGACVPTADAPCLLPPVDPGTATTVTFTLAADPGASGTGMTVTIAGRTQTAGLTVLSPYIAVVASPDSPYLRPSVTTLNLQISSVRGIANPGPLTFTLGGTSTFSDRPDSCRPVGNALTQQLSCDVSPIDGSSQLGGLTLRIPALPVIDALPLSVTDAGGRRVGISDGFGQPLALTAAGNLRLVSINPAALTAGGGSGTASMTVTNDGGLTTASTPITTRFTVGGAPTSTVAVTAIHVGDVDCNPAGQTCALPPLDPGASRTIAFELSAQSSAPAAVTFTVDIGGDIGGTTGSATITIAPGIVGLAVSPASPYDAPSKTSMTITLMLKPDVTHPGPVTLTLPDSRSSFIAAPPNCDPVDDNGSAQVTCRISVEDRTIAGLGLSITAVQPEGPLPLTVTDAGNRTVSLDDSPGLPIQVVPGPADVSLAIQQSTALPAGGTGPISVTAENRGGRPTGEGPIHYSFPAGVTVTRIDVDGVACATAEQDACVLPPVGPLQSRTVTFQLAALPTAQSDRQGAFTIAGQHAPFTLSVATGIAGLAASPDSPYFAPSTTAMDIAVTTAPGVPDPGELTFTLTEDQFTFDGSAAGCTASATDPAHEVTCPGSSITGLTLKIPRVQVAGPLPLRVTDAGGRNITDLLRDSADSELKVEAGPPKLAITALQAESLHTGGTGSASFIVSNDGGLSSPPTDIDITTPTGVEITSVQTAGTSCLPAPGSPCQLPPVDPESKATVTVNLTALPSSRGGQLVVRIGEASASADLVVTSGVTGVAVSPNGPYLAPSTVALALQVGHHGVTDPGPLTLTLTGGVRFTALPGACSLDAVGNQIVPPTQQVSCDGDSVDGLEMSIDENQPGGPLPLVVTDAAGNQIDDVRDGDGQPLEVVPAAPTHLALSPIPSLTFTAGTTRTVTAIVTNDGGRPSDPTPITWSTTTGITITSITVGGAPCALGDCSLPSLAAGQHTTVLVAVDVPPTAHDGDFTVSAGDEPTTASVKVKSGVAALQAGPDGPYVIGQASVVTITATPASGVGTLGAFTLQPTDPGLRLGPAPAGCQPEGPGGLRCAGPMITDLPLDVSATAQSGPLPLLATDAGGRPLEMTDDQGRDLAIVQPGPAVLEVTAPALTDPAYAGGTSVMTLQVANGGQRASEPSPIVVDTPHGVSVSTVAVRGADPCEPSATSPCTLPVILAGHSVDVTVDLSLDPDAQDGSLQVTTGRAAPVVQLVVLPGVSALRGAPDDPLPTGATSVLQVSANTQEGVADPGPITFPLVSGGVSIVGYPTNCLPRTTDQGTVIDCAGPVITGLGVYVGPKVPVGPLPLASDLAGNRTMPITDSNGVPLRVGPPLPPGHLTLSAPQVTGQPTAGGTGTLTLTATNSGGQPSTPLPFTVTTPAGVTVSSIQVAGQPSCTPTAQQQCVLPPIDPTRSADITVTLAVLPTAQNGPLTLSVEDTHDGSVSTDLAIGPGVSLLVATPATVLPAGATSTLRLEASLRPGVTDPGPITFPLQDDGVYVNGYPPNCRSTGAAIECSGPHIDGLALFVSRDHQLGALPLQARFAGGQTLAIADSEGRLVQVGAPVPPAHLALSGLQPGEPTIAGGAGTVAFTATNDGGETSQPTPITVTTPPGVAVARIDLAGIDPAIDPAAASCAPSDRILCRLPAITAGQSVQLTVALTAKTQAEDGPLTVAAGGATASLKPLVVHSGMSSIVGTPGGPFTQDSTTALTLTTQPAVATPGAVTLTLGRGDVSFGNVPEGCAGNTDQVGQSGAAQAVGNRSGDDHATRQITCAGPVIAGLPLIVGEHQPAGPLPLTATDAGHRDVPLTDQEGRRLTTARAPARPEPGITQVTDPLIIGGPGDAAMTVHNAGDPPAALGWQVTDVSAPLRAGGSASATVAITNTGGQPAPPRTVLVTPPAGMGISAITAGDGGLCSAPGQTCTLPPIAPGATTTVTTAVTAAPDAHDGSLELTSGDQRLDVPLIVEGGVQAVTAESQDPLDSLVSGSTARLQVAVAAYQGVTDLGRYLLELRTDQAWFSGYPASCQLPTGQAAHPTALTCTGVTLDGLQLTLAGDQPSGSLPLVVVDPGGRSLPVTDASGGPLMVVEPSPATAQTQTQTQTDGPVTTPPPASAPSTSQPAAAIAATPPELPSVAPPSGAEPSTAPTAGNTPGTTSTPAAGPSSPARSAAPTSAPTARTRATRATRATRGIR